MEHPTAPVTKRPRGRPPKVKRAGRKPAVPPVSDNERAASSSIAAPPPPETRSETGYHDPTTSHRAQTGIFHNPIPRSPLAGSGVAPTGSKRPSPDGGEYTPRAKRTRSQPSGPNPPLLNNDPTPDSSGVSPSVAEGKEKPTILPARRSTRKATIQATQISEGTLRPPGPPSLEVALEIALRNLESEMWRYLWSYYAKNRGEPLPTPAAVKEACPRVKRAAEAVDIADRELEDAIDAIMLSSSKKKPRSGVSYGKQGERSTVVAPSEKGYFDAGTGEPNSTSEREEGSAIDTDGRVHQATIISNSQVALEAASSASEPRSLKAADPVEVRGSGSRGRRTQRPRMAKSTSGKP